MMLAELTSLYSRINTRTVLYGEIVAIGQRLMRLPPAEAIQVARAFGLRLPKVCSRAFAVREVVRKLTELQQSCVRISAI